MSDGVDSTAEMQQSTSELVTTGLNLSSIPLVWGLGLYLVYSGNLITGVACIVIGSFFIGVVALE